MRRLVPTKKTTWILALAVIAAGGALWAQQEAMRRASAEAQAKGDVARAAIAEHQKALRAEKMYSCCISPGCTFCSTAADMCPCGMNLAQGKPVCPECWGGWYAGKGALPGVEPGEKMENIHVLPKSKMEMMYNMKEMSLERAAQGSGNK